MARYRRISWLIALGMSVLLADFLTKGYVFYVVPFYGRCGGTCLSIPVFHDLLGVDFAISLTTNRGAAWGLFSNFQLLLVVVRLALIGAMLWYLFFFNRNPAIEVPLVLIIAGAVGNIVDFFLYRVVIDFLSFNLWGYHFPVFNLADTSITIGVAWLICIMLFKRKNGVVKSL